MKGIVFTEFLEMVEERFSLDIADRMVGAAALPSGGAYTAVGTYDYQEMVQLVVQLSSLTGIALPDLLRAFGEYLFGRFVVVFPNFFMGVGSAFQFLQSVESYIHVEVRKLYPDAELPSFACQATQPGQLTVTYRSTRPFADLAEGLIRGCCQHFGEQVELLREALDGQPGTHERFTLTQR